MEMLAAMIILVPVFMPVIKAWASSEAEPCWLKRCKWPARAVVLDLFAVFRKISIRPFCFVLPSFANDEHPGGGKAILTMGIPPCQLRVAAGESPEFAGFVQR